MRFLKIIFIAIVFFACTPKLEVVGKPDNLLDKEKFTAVLFDVMLLESHLQSKYKNVAYYYNVTQNSVQKVLEKHAVDTSVYRLSMNYYTQKQEILKEIYKCVQDSVTQHRAILENK